MFERDLRAVALVKRWGIVPTHADQELASHSWFVTVYANDLCLVLGVTDEVRLDVLKAALGHDIDEIFTCDVPGPHKKHVMIQNSNWLHKAMEKVFPRRADRWGVKLDNAILVKAIVKVADILESVLFLIEEGRMGNDNVREHEAQLYSKLMAACDKVDEMGDTLRLSRCKKDVGEAVALARFAPLMNARITYDEED